MSDNEEIVTSDPVFQNESAFVYFTCDRDPTSEEPVVSAIGIPSTWLFYWWNTITGDIFKCVDGTEDALVWSKDISNLNLSAALLALGINSSISRNYSDDISLAFNTERTPSLTSDTMVTAGFQHTSTLLTAAEVSPNIKTDGVNFVALPSSGISGLAATSKSAYSFLVPKGGIYKFLSVSGTNSILMLKEVPA